MSSSEFALELLAVKKAFGKSEIIRGADLAVLHLARHLELDRDLLLLVGAAAHPRDDGERRLLEDVGLGDGRRRQRRRQPRARGGSGFAGLLEV